MRPTRTQKDSPPTLHLRGVTRSRYVLKSLFYFFAPRQLQKITPVPQRGRSWFHFFLPQRESGGETRGFVFDYQKNQRVLGALDVRACRTIPAETLRTVQQQCPQSRCSSAVRRVSDSRFGESVSSGSCRGPPPTPVGAPYKVRGAK